MQEVRKTLIDGVAMLAATTVGVYADQAIDPANIGRLGPVGMAATGATIALLDGFIISSAFDYMDPTAALLATNMFLLPQVQLVGVLPAVIGMLTSNSANFADTSKR